MITLANVKSWIYPGGEVGIRVENPKDNRILARIQNSDDLMKLVMYLDGHGRVISVRNDTPTVLIPYLPYARQDRVAAPGDPIGIDVIGMILSAHAHGEVGIRSVDIHSDTARHVCGAISISPAKWIGEYLDRIKVRGRCILVSPDKGAKEKTLLYNQQLELGANPPPIICSKSRDPISGKISLFDADRAPANEDEAQRPLVITDDICDGGGTFHGVYEALRHKGWQGPIHLWTTHGIYSKGTEALLKSFATLGCADTFRRHCDYEFNEQHHIIEIDYERLFH
jgi:ribose-phosphate pyrophosphokinase